MVWAVDLLSWISVTVVVADVVNTAVVLVPFTNPANSKPEASPIHRVAKTTTNNTPRLFLKVSVLMSLHYFSLCYFIVVGFATIKKMHRTCGAIFSNWVEIKPLDVES